MEITNVRNILVICIGRIGDFIIISAFVKNLKKRFPDAKVTVIAADFASDAAAIMPGVDKVLLFPKKKVLKNLIPFLAGYFSKKWDMCINMNPAFSTRAAYVVKLARSRYNVGFINDKDNSLYNITADKPDKEEHMLHIYGRLADSIDMQYEPDTELNPSAKDIANAVKLMKKLNVEPKKYIAIHPGNFGKKHARWHEDRFAELSKLIAEKSNIAQIYITGPGEEERVQSIVSAVGAEQVKMAPLTDLCTLSALFKDAACFIGGSTGTLHLADASGAPTLSLNDHYSYLVWRPLKEYSVPLTTDQWREMDGLSVKRAFAGFLELVEKNGIEL